MNSNLQTGNAEIWLLGAVAGFVTILAGLSVARGNIDGAAAWSTVLMAIVNAIKERWQSRTIDKMGQQLAGSSPVFTDTQINTVKTGDDIP